jgi:hypothetical protein
MIYNNKQSVIQLVKNPKYYEQTKHIDKNITSFMRNGRLSGWNCYMSTLVIAISICWLSPQQRIHFIGYTTIYAWLCQTLICLHEQMNA